MAYANDPSGSSARRIVSAGEDNKVKIFVKEGSDGEWTLQNEIVKDAPVWRVSFSFTGNLLSVCSGDNNTTIYKEKVSGSGEWIQETLLSKSKCLYLLLYEVLKYEFIYHQRSKIIDLFRLLSSSESIRTRQRKLDKIQQID